MTISIHPDLRGFASHVADDGRTVHVTLPEPTPELARAAAQRWLTTAGPLRGGRFGWGDELAEAR